MNFEMIMTSIIGSIIGLITVIYSGNIIFNKKCDFKIISNLIMVLLLWIFMTVNFYVGDRLIKTIFTFLMVSVLYKNIYSNDWNKAISSGIIMYLLILISEIVVGQVISIIAQIINVNLINILLNSIAINILITIPVIILVMLFKKKILSLIEYCSKKRDFGTIILFFVLMMTLTALLNKLYIGQWMFTYDFFINLLIFITIIGILIAIITQTDKFEKVYDKYMELMYYSNLTDEVLEEYRLKTHEHKNQLAIIKSLINKENLELNEYVDNLIEINKNSKYSWVNKVKYIRLPALKGLLNYKITEFNELKIETNIVVSKGMEKVTFESFTSKDKDDLYSIIGVYLDNAKEAAIESDENKINIDIALVEDKVRITIANSYKGIIDEHKLDNYKYSTKGKSRGIGLYLVKKIIKKNTRFHDERKITSKTYIQILDIKIDDNLIN